MNRLYLKLRFNARIALLVSTLSVWLSHDIWTQTVFINEFMSSNASTISDEDGDFEDWIELYNPTDAVVNVSGYFLSDNPDNPLKWELPNISIEPQGFLLIFASGKDRTDSEFLHTNFSLNIEGEPILLSSPNGDLVDYVDDVALQTDFSLGRATDGDSEWVVFSQSTPADSNINGVVHVPFTDELSFSVEQGLYESAFELLLLSTDSNSTIYYTLNGSDPDTASLLYQGAIEISNRTTLPNNFSTIPTTSATSEHDYPWAAPNDAVFKGTVIKARCFNNGEPTSELYTKTYLVDENIHERYHQLPIVSLVTDSLNLFDYETGIYVPGLASDEETHGMEWWGYGNFFARGSEFEREAHFTFFESDGSIAVDQMIGIRIHGRSTRSLPLKSLRLSARNRYGNGSMNHSFFPWKNEEQYERILLRQSGNDFAHNYIGDALSVLITDTLDFEKQDFRPAVVFINGEFWGIMNLRDRIDRRFLRYATGLDLNEDELDVNSWWVATYGSHGLYAYIQSYLDNNNLEDDVHYEHVIGFFELNSLLDYFISKIYLAVYDWPGNNSRFWRHNSESPQFRWIFFDNDHGMVDPTFNGLEHATLEGGEHWPNPEASTLLLRSLLRNEHFRELFLQRFEHLLKHAFSEERVLEAIDHIVEKIEPIMPEHIDRWNYPADVETWHNEVELVRAFARDRPCHMVNQLNNFFDITDPKFAMGVCDSISTPIPPVLSTSSKVALWPNPTDDALYLRTVDKLVVERIVCYDAFGRLVHTFSSEGWRAGENFTIYTNSLIKGHYILQIHAGDEIIIARFIKV